MKYGTAEKVEVKDEVKEEEKEENEEEESRAEGGDSSIARQSVSER